MNAPTATVLRGPSVVNEVRDLLDQLATVDALAEQCTCGGSEEFDSSGEGLATLISITPDEVLEVIARRRRAITNLLEDERSRSARAPDVVQPISEPTPPSYAVPANVGEEPNAHE